MLEKFKTVDKFGRAEIIEKKSRFISSVISVNTEKESIDFIEKIKKEYRDARHNVFAYQVGIRDEIQRYSDDGEPSGTAGIPILELLKGEDIKNTVIVVTRYFGGTLLGTGGLVRAYSKAAKEGLTSAGIVENILMSQVGFFVDYSISGKIQYESEIRNYIIDNITYTDNVEFEISMKKKYAESFMKFIYDLTKGQVKPDIKKDYYRKFNVSN